LKIEPTQIGGNTLISFNKRVSDRESVEK